MHAPHRSSFRHSLRRLAATITAGLAVACASAQEPQTPDTNAAAPVARNCQPLVKTNERAELGWALRWFRAHQLKSGAWSFDHGLAPKHLGPVNQPGTHPSQTSATGLVLLCYLGAGQTPSEGDYGAELLRAVRFLQKSMKDAPDTDDDGDLRGEKGNMVDHVVATTALCECYALTARKSFGASAQRALAFLSRRMAADGVGRWNPKEPADLRVAACQMAAMESGFLAYLRVDPKLGLDAQKLLDQLQSFDGEAYGCTSREASTLGSAAGLLSRLWTVWPLEEPRLVAGVERLSKVGAVETDPCANLAAALLCRYRDGQAWMHWRGEPQQSCRNGQVDEGCYEEDAGSWPPRDPGPFGKHTGRLGETAVRTLTLEVYYRHLPLFKEAASTAPFAQPDEDE